MALYRIYVVNTMLSVVKNMNGSLFSISGMYRRSSVLCDIPGSGLGTRPKTTCYFVGAIVLTWRYKEMSPIGRFRANAIAPSTRPNVRGTKSCCMENG